MRMQQATGGSHKAGDRKASGQSTKWEKGVRAGRKFSVDAVVGQQIKIGCVHPAVDVRLLPDHGVQRELHRKQRKIKNTGKRENERGPPN